MTRPKAKGTRAETAVVNALRGFYEGIDPSLVSLSTEDIQRRVLAGSNDKGDITGISRVCFEVKDAKTWKVAEWLRETETERVNANANYGVLVVKAPGVGHANAGRWLAVMEADAFLRLLDTANGYRPHAIRHVGMGAVGLRKGLDELVERERHCGKTPVVVMLRKRAKEAGQAAGFYSVARLDTICGLLFDAGYGGYATMGAVVSSTLKEHQDD